MAGRIGYHTKKLLIAAGRAAKGKGPLPPQLWKARHAAKPSWSEFDQMRYREVVTMVALQNVFTVVEIWKDGKASGNPDVMKLYAQLVGDGIVGKGI